MVPTALNSLLTASADSGGNDDQQVKAQVTVLQELRLALRHTIHAGQQVVVPVLRAPSESDLQPRGSVKRVPPRGIECRAACQRNSAERKRQIEAVPERQIEIYGFPHDRLNRRARRANLPLTTV